MSEEHSIRSKVSGFARHVSWRSALGELVLIVVGVLVALAVNNWNLDRQDRKTERSLLRQLRSALERDLATLKEADQGFRSRKQRMEALRDHLRRGLPYADSLPSAFGVVLGIWPIHFNRGPYDVLKVRGLSLVSNDALRLRIVSVFDETYADYQDSQEDDRNVVFEIVRPYYLRAFQAIRFRESATPIKYDEIVKDPYFINVLDYRLRSLEVNSIEAAEGAIREVSGLLEDLDQEIARHR